ncbi:SDR family NAD(P)-dependent oxidoreductase [Micromonospora haikouensis]|uniref:SDR family NAD(P)-dependent oxidoreductase n=1 Tax=Micromonospora haikouensis TaxID=686309 RepID=UPI003D72C911
MTHVKISADRFGPWALVTGASSGIGREFARQLAANGRNVVLAARRTDTLAELGAEIESRYALESGRGMVIPGVVARMMNRLPATLTRRIAGRTMAAAAAQESNR